MAILSEQIYKLIRTELFNAGLTAYSDKMPDEKLYPFVVYSIDDIINKPDLGFNKEYEHIPVKFYIYGDKTNPHDVIDIAEQIETIFNRTKKTFVDTTNGKYLVANKKEDDDIRFLDENDYWLATTTYAFCAQRNL